MDKKYQEICQQEAQMFLKYLEALENESTYQPHDILISKTDSPNPNISKHGSEYYRRKYIGLESRKVALAKKIVRQKILDLADVEIDEPLDDSIKILLT